MKWVTRAGVRMDRSACGWLIRRHIDPLATIMYVDAQAMPEAIASGALPFHETVAEEGEVIERTSFQQLLTEYGLDESDPALTLMGDIVRAAETGEPVAEAPGLSAIARGMNALAKSDQDMVERMMLVFDALYAYCRRQVLGLHGWANAEPGWPSSDCSRYPNEEDDAGTSTGANGATEYKVQE